MKLKTMFLLLLSLAVVFISCDDDDDKKKGQPDSYYMASQSVSSNGEAVVESESGASIVIPMYAVPFTDSGENGTMVFSIERDQSVAANPPAGESLASPVYRFGPDGFVFAEAVTISIPFEGDFDQYEYRMYRINPTTGEAEQYPITYDSLANTVSTQTFELSPWFITSQERNAMSCGAIKVTNNSLSDWLTVSVVNFTPKYPEFSRRVPCGTNTLWAPVGRVGWNNSGNWYLQQGTYTFCVSMRRSGTISSPPGAASHTYVYDIVIDQPWSYYNPIISANISFSSITGGEAGECDCRPVPTTSPGTGDVQVTLTWYNSQSIDVDLWVIEPSGEKCYYSNDITATGGTLDRDNLCSNYINGRPENIFWSEAPAGLYKIIVHWYSDCGNTISSQPFNVRVVNGNNSRTYNGTLTEPYQEIEVATFTHGVNSIAPSMSEYIGRSKITTDLPEKY